MTYRIRDWNNLFENNRTRELKKLDWVPIPNKMDGLGYSELVDHPDGAAHFGAWVAIVEIASRQPVRGTLPQHHAGIPHALARISRLPAGLFEAALPRLEAIGWIEQYQQVIEIPHQDAGKSQDGAEIPQDGAVRVRAREGKGMEGKEGNLSDPNGGSLVEQTAERMYALHPKKKNKPLVEQALLAVAQKSADAANKLAEIESCHKAWCATDDWNERNGKFAPKLDEWLVDEGFTKRPREPTAAYVYTPPDNLLTDEVWERLKRKQRGEEIE